MDKKALIVQVLEKIQDTWLPAKGLVVLLQYGEVNDATLDALLHIVEVSIHDTKNIVASKVLEQSHKILEKIKLKESEDQSVVQHEIDDLDATLQNM